MKLTNICFKTNDLLECIVKLVKFHKTQVGEKGERLTNNQAWRVIEDQGKWSSLKKSWRSRYKTVSR